MLTQPTVLRLNRLLVALRQYPGDMAFPEAVLEQYHHVYTDDNGKERQFRFAMHRYAISSSSGEFCGTAGCAMGLDWTLRGVVGHLYDSPLDQTIEKEGYYHSSNDIFYGMRPYNRTNTLRDVTPGQVADRLAEFIAGPDEYEQKAKAHYLGVQYGEPS